MNTKEEEQKISMLYQQKMHRNENDFEAVLEKERKLEEREKELLNFKQEVYL